MYKKLTFEKAIVGKIRNCSVIIMNYVSHRKSIANVNVSFWNLRHTDMVITLFGSLNLIQINTMS